MRVTLMYPGLTSLGGDFSAASSFVHRKFVSLSENRSRSIYSHYTHATDRKQLQKVMKNVADIILRKGLKESGFV